MGKLYTHIFALLFFVSTAVAQVPVRAASDIEKLAEEAIANAGASANQIFSNPSELQFRKQYETAIQNLWLARQAIEAEFREGLLSETARLRLLAKMGRFLEATPRSPFRDALSVSLDTREAENRFVPDPISRNTDQEADATEAPDVDTPSLSRYENAILFLSGDQFSDPLPPLDSEKTIEAVAGRTRARAPGQTLPSGYNAPVAASPRPLSGVLDTAPILEEHGVPLKELLSAALSKSRAEKTLVSTVAPRPLAPGFKSLTAGLSGSGSSRRLAGATESIHVSSAQLFPSAKPFRSLSTRVALGVLAVVLMATGIYFLRDRLRVLFSWKNSH